METESRKLDSSPKGLTVPHFVRLGRAGGLEAGDLQLALRAHPP